ncbi:hypothetical protein TBLA_0D01210 [Henningerozyma blattae CBS 6284]|uniref:GPN-loop GTPase 2 n=1 Tax=Henningerozyma blattae (strain ATCC 34711 / CBS 6284 / DSM 70876 / NBRC 10599 / NRRL Y-10934 / UCD 77-7) TaxID=1071380 RepID=I2H2M7_HENB6|nr:hypothetical protein TBLA_0D01210 [Tetrapisispora blattae CBS 6284]CCH60629.1 hypothetical protein TBLA_0D01210 [Tetrapisispora blattae CBS 6284]
MPFGQVIIGPPGSGKSTYAFGCYQFFNAIGRHTQIINMDPANDRLPYPVSVDIRDFITLEEIMNEKDLGPNGGLMYAMESINNSLDLFVLQIKALLADQNNIPYLIFDCPGQVELFTHHSSLFHIFKILESKLDMRFCVVNLVDSIYITSPSQYVSILLLTLRSMLMMDLPQINVFSKIDKLKSYNPELPFKLDYYTEVQDLNYLQPFIEEENKNNLLLKKYSKLTSSISEIVSDFNLVSFEVLSIDNKQSMINLQMNIDKANGYIFGTSEIGGDTVWAEATRQNVSIMNDIDIQDRWLDNKEKYDKEEIEQLKQLQQEDKVNDKEIDVNDDDEWERALKEWEDKKGMDYVR